jgi:hypothetical protein
MTDLSPAAGGAVGTVTEEINYRTAYLEIAGIVFSRFPTCEITTVDMVRMLAFENDTLRIALNMPLAKQVLSVTENNDN